MSKMKEGTVLQGGKTGVKEVRVKLRKVRYCREERQG